jgi:hypothetical protein
MMQDTIYLYGFCEAASSLITWLRRRKEGKTEGREGVRG